MALPTSYEQSIIRHETRFTPYFATAAPLGSYVRDGRFETGFCKPHYGLPAGTAGKPRLPVFLSAQLFTPYAG